MDVITRNKTTRQLLDQAIECLEIARRCEQASGYVAASGRWIDTGGEDRRAILGAERERQYGLASECIGAIGRLAKAD